MNKYIVCGMLAIAFSCGNTEQNSSTAPQEKKDSNAVESSSNPEVKNIKTVLGVDVSHFQGDVNWQDIKTDGVLFAYAKATQGAYYSDPKFAENWKNMSDNDLYKGAYHFYVYEDNALDQAKHFINTVKDLRGDMPPVIDLESGGLDGQVNLKDYQKGVSVWLQAVEKALGVTPVIYTNPSFGNEYLNNPVFAKYDLWLADYVKENPEVPEIWKDHGWTIWQRAQEGVLNGINGNVDHDIFNGDLIKFKKELLGE